MSIGSVRESSTAIKPKPSDLLRLVKLRLENNWKEPLSRFAKIPIEHLDEVKHPCPWCMQGDKPFRLVNPNDGACVCSHCFKVGDGFAAIQHANGWTFPDTVRALAEWLGMTEPGQTIARPVLPEILKPNNAALPSVSQQGKPTKADNPAPDSQLEFQPWSDGLAAIWCLKNKPITVDALKAFGARFAKYRNRYIVLAIPTWGPELDQAAPVGWILYNATGGTLPSNEGPVRKKATAGSSAGINGTVDRLRNKPSLVLKTEGQTDGMAALPLVDASTAIFCNAFGANENPDKPAFEFLKALLADSTLLTINDADKAGEDGLAKWSNYFASFTKSKVVRLPYEVVPSHGKDLRDWINDGNGRPELEALFAAAELVTHKRLIIGISNFTINVDEEVCPRPVSEIVEDIANLSGGWPKVANGVLFAMAEGEIVQLNKQASLFAWLRGMTQVNWRNSANLLKESELFETLLRRCQRYDEILKHPHLPSPMAGVFYACDKPTPDANGYLDKFLEFFNPSTDEDRELMKAAVVTLFWNGGPGQRVGFIVSSTHGQGGGKTVFVHRIAQLVGGVIELSQKGDIEDAKTRILSPGADGKQALLIDNVKSSRFGSGDLEALVTAPTISGHRMYQGEATRKNYFTFFLTMNSPSFSRDTAQRFINIVLGSPSYDSDWHASVEKFINDHRSEIIADIAAFFSRPKAPLSRFNRWGAWQGEVLSRLKNPEAVLTTVLAREDENDSDKKAANEIEEYVTGRLKALGYDASKTAICEHIPSSHLAEWISQALGESYTPKLASQLLDRLEGAKLLYSLSRNKSRASNYGRGFVFRGGGLTGFSISYELAEKLNARKNELIERKKVNHDGTF